MNIKMIQTLFGIYFLAITFISVDCSNKNNESKDNIADTLKTTNFQDTLKEINRQIEEAIYNSDYETLLKYYADDAIVVPNFQPVLHGKDALRESYLKQEKEGVKIHSFHGKIDKIWAGNSNVYEYGTYGLSFSSNKTKHPYGVTGSYFMIWEKQKSGSYLIKYFISNLDFNPCKDYL